MTAPERVDLPVSGMTCAACARAIERTLCQHRPAWSAPASTWPPTPPPWSTTRRASRVRDFIGAIEDLGYGVPETAAAAGRRGTGLSPAPAGGRRLRRAGDGAGHVAPLRRGSNWRSRCR